MPSVNGHDSSYWAGNTMDPASTGSPGQQKPGWQNHKPNSERMSEESPLSGLAAGVRTKNAQARGAAFKSQGADASRAQPYGQQPYDPRYAQPMSFTTGVLSQLVGQWRHDVWGSLGRIPFLGRRADQFLATLQHAAVNFETSVFRKLGGGFAPQHYPQPPHWGGMQQPVHPQPYGQPMPPQQQPYRQAGAPGQPLAKEAVSQPLKEQAKPAEASSRKEFLHNDQANIGKQQRAGEAVNPQDVNAANKKALDEAIAESYRTGLEKAMGDVNAIKSPTDAVATSIRVFDEFRARAKDILFQPLSDLPSEESATGRKMLAPLWAAFSGCLEAIGDKGLELRFSPEQMSLFSAADREMVSYKHSVATLLDARLADRDPATQEEMDTWIKERMTANDAPVDQFKKDFAKGQEPNGNRNPGV